MCQIMTHQKLDTDEAAFLIMPPNFGKFYGHIGF